jgi:hypothetical protein
MLALEIISVCNIEVSLKLSQTKFLIGIQVKIQLFSFWYSTNFLYLIISQVDETEIHVRQILEIVNLLYIVLIPVKFQNCSNLNLINGARSC